jgi:hypothetical protein
VILWWRREPRFKKVVRPEEPLEKVYCHVFDHENMNPDSPCRLEKGWYPRLTGVWVVPDRTSKIYWLDDELTKFRVAGGTFLLYPATLRPGACTDNRGGAGISFYCAHPDIVEYEEGRWVRSVNSEKYFRLRDDVEEVGARWDRFGHPIYIVRNRLGETFRLAGVYARLYEALKNKGGWVKGSDLLGEELELTKRYGMSMGEVVEKMRDEELEELTAEFANAAFEVADRMFNLLSKLNRGMLDELPPPGVIPADLERSLAKVESYESLFEALRQQDLTRELKDQYGGDVVKTLRKIIHANAALALGLLVYEALIVEMGIE